MPVRDNEYVTGTTDRLRHTRAYLCGAMDRVADGGEGWRIRLRRELADLGITWLDPTNKPIDVGIEDVKMREGLETLKQQNQFDDASGLIKVIRAVDLRMVDHSDFLVVNLDLEVHACGTYEELFLANRQKKPIIIRIEQGKENTPNWLLAAVPHETIFSTWAEVGEYLKHVSDSPMVKHLNRWMFFRPPFKFSPATVARFWMGVERTPGCWFWKGASVGKYGNFRHEGQQLAAHRVAYELINGPFDSRLYVLHKCDTPRCVNPAHLFAGTQKENLADMRAKGRQSPEHGKGSASGELSGRSKLTLEDVETIRANTTDTSVTLGRRYGVSSSQIGNIRNYRSWKP